MTRDELLALAERAEATKGPDRDLDQDIHDAVLLGCMTTDFRPFAAHYTQSLDAAMMLVPEGMILRRYWTTKHVPHCVEVSRGHASGGWISECDSSFALALTAAALRAIAEEMK